MGVILLAFLLLAVGLALVVFGADWLVDGAARLAAHFGVPQIVIGLTLVAFGTSLPEMVVSLLAALKGSPGLTLGNVVGSNIANILLIGGVAALFHPLYVKGNTVYREIPFMLLASVLLFVFAADKWLAPGSAEYISRAEGIAMLSFFLVFLYYVFSLMNGEPDEFPVDTGEPRAAFPLGAVFKMLAGIAILIAGGQLAVDSAVKLALRFGASELLIGATLVAVGTSLPELVTSAVAAYRKNADLAIGNIVGSCIFNVFLVMGLVSVISPVPVDSVVLGDMTVGIVAAVALFLVMFTGKPAQTVQRAEGALFLLGYGAYTTWLIMRG